MEKAYVLYNPKAGNQEDVQDIRDLELVVRADLKYIDITGISDYGAFFAGLDEEDGVILAGGDGTLNRFVNDTEGLEYENDILYYPIGSGNDFAHDLGKTKGCEPFRITEQLKDLPCVTVKGKNYRFINNVGFGIDGYCCEVGDELRKIPNKKINYTTIAIKGLLFRYKPTGARVTVDGVSHTYEKVWLAPTMHGRFYGGGMMAAPQQDRDSRGKTLSAMVLHGSGKLKTLTVFPSIFKGEHVKHTEIVEILTGHEITVEFDQPRAVQIDGETIPGVTSYTAVSAAKMAEKKTVCAAAE